MCASRSDILVEVTYFERVESFGPNFELLIPLGYTPNHLPVNEMHIRCPVTFAVCVHPLQRATDILQTHLQPFFTATQEYAILSPKGISFQELQGTSLLAGLQPTKFGQIKKTQPA